MSKRKKVDVVAEDQHRPAIGQLINHDLLTPGVNRTDVVKQILEREAGGEVPDIDDLIIVLRRAPEDCRSKVFERVKARADQLRYNHWHICIRMCGGEVKDWAEHNRSYFNKRVEEPSVSRAVPAAIPA